VSERWFEAIVFPATLEDVTAALRARSGATSGDDASEHEAIELDQFEIGPLSFVRVSAVADGFDTELAEAIAELACERTAFYYYRDTRFVDGVALIARGQPLFRHACGASSLEPLERLGDAPGGGSDRVASRSVVWIRGVGVEERSPRPLREPAPSHSPDSDDDIAF
jgi:hypothetical protein